MLIAAHDIGLAITVLLAAASVSVPFVIAWRWSWKLAAAVVAAWTVFGFAVFYRTPGVGTVDSVGVAVILFLVPWLAALLAGVGLRRRRQSQPDRETELRGALIRLRERLRRE